MFVPAALAALACIAAIAGDHLVREATVQWHQRGARIDACDGIELLGVLAAARERYPAAARLLAAADAARQPLGYLAPGFTATRQGSGRKRPATGWASLTPAELQVVRLISEGLRNDAIATRTELAAQAASQNLTAGSPGQ
jgi:ATP/maltotriose-dependent transcriptional regulator MalT